MNQFLKGYLLAFSLLIIFVGCKSGAKGEDILKKENLSGAATDNVDVDLTELSSTMVYGEVYQMMMAPEEYIGKTIKMRGTYYASLDETSKQYYHFAIISDATACCAQGLEFLWTGEHSYPKDYPAENTQIEITGEFESYQEGEQTYYHIVTDEINMVE